MTWDNHAEQYVDIFKKAITKDIKTFNEILILCCYFSDRLSEIINPTVCDNYQLNGQTPHTLMTGQTTDTSDICGFGWYNWCYYRDPSAKLLNPVGYLGRVLVPEDHAGIVMSQWVTN